MASPANCGSAHFMGLSSSTRLSILRLAGLVRRCPIDLDGEYRRIKYMNDHDLPPALEKDCDTRESTRRCMHAALPTALLRVNRQLYKEAVSVLYGENKFHVTFKLLEYEGSDNEWHYYGPYEMGLNHTLFPLLEMRLQKLTPLAYAHLSELHICISKIKDYQRYWRILQHFLKNHLHQGITHLAVFCNVRYVDPQLIDQLTELAANWERLGLRGFSLALVENEPCEENLPLRNLRREKIKRSLFDTPPKSQAAESTSSFPFEKLPPELRLEILLYTGLAGPQGDRNDEGVRPHFASMSMLIQDQKCCGACTAPMQTCACNWQVAYSTTCSCSKGPAALFSVSRGLRADALHMYYSQQPIAVHCVIPNAEAKLREIASPGFESLRKLTIVVEPSYQLPVTEFGNWEEIRHLFEMLAASCNMSRFQLNFRLRLRYFTGHNKPITRKRKFRHMKEAVSEFCSMVKSACMKGVLTVPVPRRIVVSEHLTDNLSNGYRRIGELYKTSSRVCLELTN